MQLNIKKISSDAKLPNYAHADDAGMDLYSNEKLKIKKGEIKKVKTGFALEIPEGYAGLVWDKSGIATKGIKTLAGVIDSGYRGEVVIVLTNLSDSVYRIEKGQKIAQMLMQKIERFNIREVENLNKTSRGDGKFGSTGIF